MVKSIDTIQQIIMKPEWKTLVGEVMENTDITKVAQEHVVRVANAIVTPLSLLVFAADLPPDEIEKVSILWKETLQNLGAKCEMRCLNSEEKGTQVQDDITDADSQADQQSTEKPKVVRKIIFSAEENAEAEEGGEQDGEPNPESRMPSSSEDSDTTSHSESQPSEKENGESDEQNKAFNEGEVVEIDQLNQASVLVKGGQSAKRVLAGTAAKKGLTDSRTFHKRTRSRLSKVRTGNP